MLVMRFRDKFIEEYGQESRGLYYIYRQSKVGINVIDNYCPVVG